ncbi:MBL fold metallo-hydrolase [Thioalkalivibrio sp.]|uniref:MBL fold metallo-hydrolase n=1 Tax=Thioalkalivibrio sp. TaxID=2093813 RepID=UPI0035679A0F
MIFKQFYLESLGHASYFIGSEDTGEALVLDVRRDVDDYLEEAQARGMRLRYAADSHQHNDYLSGICELPARADVQLLAGARAELGYPVHYMDDGEHLRMGEIEFEVVHTPGHTPEHISLLVYDGSRGREPALLLSGGALLVDDIARPDLLGGEEETRAGAREFCHTLQEKILRLPDHVAVYPTHVAGSLCGGNIGSMLSTTIGYERRMNQMLADLDDREGFVERCLELKDLPTVPPYWRRMRSQNIQGPKPLGVLPDPPAIRPDDFADLSRRDDTIVVDCRSPEAFTAHIPGALNVGAGTSFSTWAGTVLPEDARLLLVVEQPGDLEDIYWQLLRIGYDLPAAWLSGGMLAWRTSGREVEILPQWTVHELREAAEHDRDLTILDVRQPAEWSEGHIAGARHVSGGELPRRLDEIPKNRPLAVICGSGYRSSVMASLLSRQGHGPVFNVLGGMTGWQSAGYDIEAA